MDDENILPENNSNAEFDKTKKGFSIASMVLGIIGICFCYGGFIFALLAIIFGAVSIHKKQGIKGMAIAGIILCVIDILISIIIMVLSYSALPTVI